MPQPPRGVFVNRAVYGICFHQSDGAQRERDAMPQRAALVEIKLQAAAAEIENQPRLHPVAQRPVHGRADQPRFFLAADHFQLNPGFALDALHQPPVVAHLPRCGRRDRAV